MSELSPIGQILPSDHLLTTSRDYALYVVDTRGIPRVTDSLKSVQRVSLWLLRNRSEKIKTNALSGMLMAERLYNHGEASSNGAIGLLAAPYKNNQCLIQGLGQFGSRVAPDKDGIGAPRYTDVKRSKFAEHALYVDLDLVPLVDNYDGSNKAPATLLPIIPLVLLNGVAGIAVGWSTEILPRKLTTLIEATKCALLGKPIPEMVPHYERYDVAVASTGKPNQWEISGKVQVVDTSTVRVTELPVGLRIDDFRKALNLMEEQDIILSYVDRSSDRIDITIRMKRGSVKDWTEDFALTFLRLREKVTERIVTVGWNGDSVLTYDEPKALVSDFAAWRLGWYSKRFQKLIDDASYENQFWITLACLFADEFPKRLGTFPDKASMVLVVERVIDEALGLRIDGATMDRVISLPTYRWTHDFQQEVLDKIEKLNEDIAGYEKILGSPDLLRKVYISELDALAKMKF